MSDQMFALKIDLKKILEDRTFKANSGAVYLDCIMIPSQRSAYGDSHMIVQSLPKEEREAGKRGPIIGNAKILQRSGTAPASKPAPKPAESTEEVPF